MIHLVIVWSKAMSYKDEIISDISNQFQIRKIFKVHWDKDSYYENLKIFYSHSLKDFSDSQFDRIIKSKIRNIGVGEFLVIVFNDDKPCVEKRETTSGVVEVNTHVFDLKTKYRNIIGGSRIHSSNDSWETNKDLTLLFGLNIDDFIQKYKEPSLIIEEFRKNCIGYNGYSNIEEFFYVLNNCIKYVVLRNHENLPDKYVSSEHGDIDLLVEHKNYALKLTKAERVFRQKYRVYHYIKIGGDLYPFDFRYIGDHYYDEVWERNIISMRKLVKNIFYAPDDTDQFYSLLYHAYIQKTEVKEDYFDKLKLYAEKIGVKYNHKDYKTSLGLIYDFLCDNNYSFLKPEDLSVYYNRKNILICEAYNYLINNVSIEDLKPIHLNHPFLSGYIYFSGNIHGRKVFIKYGGSGNSCQKEYEFTKRVYSYAPKHFTEALSLNNHGEYFYAIYEYLEGESLDSYLEHHQTINKIALSEQLGLIYKALNDARIIHRDIQPDNFIVVGDRVVLIDFQYAIDATVRKEYDYLLSNPTQLFSLGNIWRYKWYAWSDYHSLLKTADQLNLQFTSKNCESPFYLSIKLIGNKNFWPWLVRKIYKKIRY